MMTSIQGRTTAVHPRLDASMLLGTSRLHGRYGSESTVEPQGRLYRRLSAKTIRFTRMRSPSRAEATTLRIVTLFQTLARGILWARSGERFEQFEPAYVRSTNHCLRYETWWRLGTRSSLMLMTVVVLTQFTRQRARRSISFGTANSTYLTSTFTLTRIPERW